MIGRRVEIAADLNRVRVRCDGLLVANHDRVWARHQTSSDPPHVAAATELRRDRIGLVRRHAARGSVRCLADYDAALGLDELSEGGTGGEGRIRAAWLPARKSFEEFDFDHARDLTRNVIAHLGALDLSWHLLDARLCAVLRALGDAQHVSST